MEAFPVRSLLPVAALQASIAMTALILSPRAAFAAAAIGALALGRYAALAVFAATLGPGANGKAHSLAASAWALGFLALLAGIAAVALRVRPALPWAVAAAFAGPLAWSGMAVATGLGCVIKGRAGRGGRGAPPAKGLSEASACR
jgi:hypothetical protein